MNKSLYRKLARQNIKSNKNTFLPFAICTMAMVSLFYMLVAVAYQVSGTSFFGARTMANVLGFGVIICGIFSFVVLIYTNNFLIKRRAKELGLYSMLGMEKIHISKVLFWEMAYTGLASIAAGLVLGMLFSKLTYLILGKMINMNIQIGFSIDLEPVVKTLLLFVAVFVVAIIFNAIRIARLNPIDLMRTTKAGEKEPKANWILAIIGLGLMGTGYYLAVSTENPVKALELFFVAVLLVIVGTYFVFISATVAILKALKKNKAFYYKKKNFVTVSGLIYRMKQNAVGLANICVLSTAVLVTLFSTLSLYIGTEDAIKANYPYDIDIVAYDYDNDELGEEVYQADVIAAAVEKRAKKKNVKIKNAHYYFSDMQMGEFSEDSFKGCEYYTDTTGILAIMPAEDYERLTGVHLELQDNEAAVYFKSGRDMTGKSFTVSGQEVKVVASLDEENTFVDASVLAAEYCNMVVKDYASLQKLHRASNIGDDSFLLYNYEFDIEGTDADKLAFSDGLRKTIEKTDTPHLGSVRSIYVDRQDYINLYGSLFFIGIFIGMMFLVATVMIIYYKQISEGFEDREKFAIMRKVGMSDREIKSTIKAQILMVFFLPIILAIIHIAFAFKAIAKILLMFGIMNTSLILGCLAGTVLVYLLIYVVVFSITARSYYRCLA